MVGDLDYTYLEEKLDKNFSKFAFTSEDGATLWGIWRNSDQIEVIPDKYTVIECVTDDVFFGIDTKGHSYLFFDNLEKRIDISEDISFHLNRMNLSGSCMVSHVSASTLPEYYGYFGNVPVFESHKLIILEGIIDNHAFNGCLKQRTDLDNHSELLVPILYDELFFSHCFVSARRNAPVSHSLSSGFWEFYPYFPHKDHYISLSGPQQASQSPLDSVPSNVDLLVFTPTKDGPTPYAAFSMDDVDSLFYPIPVSKDGYYVIIGDIILKVSVVDRVVEITEGESLITIKNKKYGICGNSLKLEHVYDKISKFYYKGSCPFLKIVKYGKTGAYKEEDGSFITPVFDDIEPVLIDEFAYYGVSFIVRVKNIFGVISEKGDVIIPLAYDSIKELSYYSRDVDYCIENVQYKVESGGLYGIFGLFEPKYEDIKLFVRRESTYASDIPYYGLKRSAGGWSIADKSGRVLTKHEYDSIDYSKEIDCFIFKKDGTTGTISITELKNE